mgnify:CR=1 FL=1
MKTLLIVWMMGTAISLPYLEARVFQETPNVSVCHTVALKIAHAFCDIVIFEADAYRCFNYLEHAAPGRLFAAQCIPLEE